MTTEDVIAAAVVRCDRIVAGVDDLRPFLAPVLPATDGELEQLPVVERIASVALLKRYEQLQDMLGRLLRVYLSWELEDPRAMTRRDQANQLEKLEVIGDADQWVDASELRNRLVHEYPVDQAEQALRVNQCWVGIFELIEVYSKLRLRLDHKGLVP